MNELRNRTVLGADCRMAGNLHLDNDAVIMGQFEGTLRVTGHLVLPERARVTGTIAAGSVKLGGTIKGRVIVEDTLELLATAQIDGEVFATHLVSDPQAAVEGLVSIGPGAMSSATALLEEETHSHVDEPALATSPSAMPSIRIEQVTPPKPATGSEEAQVSDSEQAYDGMQQAIEAQHVEDEAHRDEVETLDDAKAAEPAAVEDEDAVVASMAPSDAVPDDESGASEDTFEEAIAETSGGVLELVNGEDAPDEEDEDTFEGDESVDTSQLSTGPDHAADTDRDATDEPQVTTYSLRLNELLQRRRSPRVLRSDGTLAG